MNVFGLRYGGAPKPKASPEYDEVCGAADLSTCNLRG